MHIGRIAVEVSVLSASLIGPSLIGDPTVAAETNEQPGVDVASIVGYLEALSTVDASPALAVASPRSPAWRYAEHQVAFEVALRENGSAPAADIISPLSDGRFQSCAEARTPFCAVFGDFTADSAGLISAFTVDGVEITPRVGDPSDPTTFEGVTARVRSSYRTVRSDALIVVLELDTDVDVTLFGTARYDDPSGQQVEQVDAFAPPTLPTDSSATIALVFQSVDPGGHLVWELSPAAGGTIVLDLTVPALLTGAEFAVAPVPAAPAPPETSATSTTVEPLRSDVIDALGTALATSLGVSGGGVAELDVSCLEKAVSALPPSTQRVIGQFASDPSLFDTMNNQLARVFAVAYIGCVDNEDLIGLVAAIATGAIQQLECVAGAWASIVTPEAIASSLAYGTGLDDLPADVVDAMTLAAASCVPVRWWIEDEAAALGRSGLGNDQAMCVATTIVDEFGVAPIIRRRILGLDLLPVAQAELDAADLPTRCDVQFPRATQLDAPPGTCLTGFLEGPGRTDVIDCSQPHNAEVVTVIDLGEEFPSWPGAQVLRDTAADRCAAAVEALAVDGSEYAAGWDIPVRLLWEQSLRMLTCTLIRTDASAWTGATGLVPTGQPAPSLSRGG